MFHALNRLIIAVSELTGSVAAILFSLVALIVTFDVVSRTLLTIPTTWALESVTYMMVAAVFIGAPYVTLKNEHIAIDLLVNTLSPRVRIWTHRIVLAIVVVFFLVITWQAFGMVMRAKTLGLSSPTIYIPIWPIQLMIPIGAFLTAIEAARQIIVGASAGGHGS